MPAHPTAATLLCAGRLRSTPASFQTHRETAIEPTDFPATVAATTPAWIVFAWPPVLWQATAAPALRFVHLGTRVLNPGRGSGGDFCEGQTLWGEANPDRSAGVAWDWVDIGDGVIAMADPLGLVTNLRLVGINGAALSAGEIAMHLHQIVHALPWQTEVRRALDDGPPPDLP